MAVFGNDLPAWLRAQQDNQLTTPGAAALQGPAAGGLATAAARRKPQNTFGVANAPGLTDGVASQVMGTMNVRDQMKQASAQLSDRVAQTMAPTGSSDASNPGAAYSTNPYGNPNLKYNADAFASGPDPLGQRQPAAAPTDINTPATPAAPTPPAAAAPTPTTNVTAAPPKPGYRSRVRPAVATIASGA